MNWDGHLVVVLVVVAGAAEAVPVVVGLELRALQMEGRKKETEGSKKQGNKICEDASPRDTHVIGTRCFNMNNFCKLRVHNHAMNLEHLFKSNLVVLLILGILMGYCRQCRATFPGDTDRALSAHQKKCPACPRSNLRCIENPPAWRQGRLGGTKADNVHQTQVFKLLAMSFSHNI